MSFFSSLALAFLAYSFIGWLLDTAVRSLLAGRFVRGGFSKLPVAPVYGFGALLALAAAPHIRHWPLLLQGLVLALLLGAYEWLSGEATSRLFRRRLWDYPSNALNLRGFTDAVHAAAWGALGLFLIHVLQPKQCVSNGPSRAPKVSRFHLDRSAMNQRKREAKAPRFCMFYAH